MAKKKTQEEFLEDVAELKNKNLSLENFVYKDALTKGLVKCSKHSTSFYMLPNKVKIGQTGCALCEKESTVSKLKLSNEEVLKRFKKVHQGIYDYSLVEYTNNQTPVTIICKKHGEFKQAPDKHWGGSKCPQCFKDEYVPPNRLCAESVYSRAVEKHDGAYNYTGDYSDYSTKMTVVCKEHGPWEVLPYNHIGYGSGCPKCTSQVSKGEDKLAEFICSLPGMSKSVERNVPILEDRKHIDILIREKSIGIEYCGVYWHSEERGKSKTYHLDKLRAAEKLGIRLVQVFEDEWQEKKDIVKSRLKSLLGVDITYYARKSILKPVSNKVAEEFFKKTHIQGSCPLTDKNLGLYNRHQELIACMSFGEPRFSKGNGEIELLRYSSTGTIVGGFSKLLKASCTELKSQGFTKVISYSDKRWSVGGVYSTCGFTKESTSAPGYFYVKAGKRYNRVKFQKHKLAELLPVFDSNLSEAENMRNNNYFTIYDCGMDKWVLEL